MSALHELDPTGRFSNRVDNYAKYRPPYPPQLIGFLEQELGLRKGQQIADIGSGTGILTELLLLKGYSVTGIEPNAGMREAAEHRLGGYERFYSLEGRAECTGLENSSIDLITVAQAFHWMDPQPARIEFMRILKEGGHIVLIWNLRVHHTPFLRSYEELVRQFGKNYEAANRADDHSIASFFHPLPVHRHVFENIRLLDFTALKGLVLSSSYMPVEGDPGYEPMLQRLEELFAIHHENGLVRMEYETRTYFNL